VFASGANTCGVFVDEMTKDIEGFNRLVPESQQINVKTSVRDISSDWALPEEYMSLDVRDYVVAQLYNHLQDEEMIDNLGNVTKEGKDRILRTSKELELFTHHNLMDVLRVIIFIINTLSERDAVWGVGRGSSVSSYVLYLIGAHDIDSCKYDLDFGDFLHLDHI